MGLLDLLIGRSGNPNTQTVETKNVRGVEVKIVEVGTPGTEIFGGYLAEEYLKELTGTDWADKVDMMRRSDANVRMVLNAIKLPLKSSPWTIVLREKSDEAELQKKLFEKILFEDLNKSFTQLVGEILTCLDFGYSIFDITHAVKTDKELGTYNSLKSLGYRSQRTIDRWNLNDARDLETVTQTAYGDEGGTYELDARFLLYFAPEREGDNFEGISVLRACYGPWFRKNEFLKKLAIGIEKFAVPTAVLTVPEGTEGKPEMSAAKKALACYTSGQTNYLILPKGFELSFNNVSVDVEKIRSAINAENQEMVNSILASFLLLGQNGSGSLALSGTLSDFFSQTVQYIADHISEQFDRKIFKPLVQMNFGHEKVLVDLKCDGLEHRANEAWANMVNGFIGTGAIKADDDLEVSLREKLNLPPKKDSEIEYVPSVQPESVDMDAVASAAQGVDLQSQALNGAQVSSLVDVIQKVASGLLPRDSAVGILQVAFQLTTEQAEKILSTAGRGFKIDPGMVGKLAEKKKTKEPPQSTLIRDTADRIRMAGQGFLPAFAKKYARSILIQKNKASASDQIKAPIKATVPGLGVYQSALTSAYMIAKIEADEIQGKAFKGTKKTLSEFRLGSAKLKRVTDAVTEYEDALLRLMGAQGDKEIDDAIYALGRISDKVNLIFGDYLTPAQKKAVSAKVEVFSDTQKNDVVKAIDLQYQNSLVYTDNDEELDADMMEAGGKAIAGPMTTAGPDVQASQVVNDGLLEAAEKYAEETGDQIISYTYVAKDDDRTTEICREMDGTTFSADDPNVTKFSPPLHFNCRSFMQVNTSTTKNNPKVTGLPKLSKVAQGQMQFAEYPQSKYELAEYQGRKVELEKPFRTPEGPKKFGVYVKNDKGNVVLVRFGDPKMDIKRDDLERRRNFRARHQCDTDPGPKWKARYWSCKFWSSEKVGDLV
jgi:SPP1 gp7 family putative phage head morphogenesis protein